MKVINFLPDDYLERCRRRRANIVCLAIAATAVVALGGLSGFAFFNVLSVASVRGAVEQQYQEASQQIDQLRQLEEHRSTLLRKVELSTGLLERVPRSQLLARLTNYLPPHTNLVAVAMRLEDIEIKAPQPPGGNAAGGAGGPAAQAVDAAKNVAKAPLPADARKDKSGAYKVKQCVFRVDGMAPTDFEVAEYIQRLAADPLFRHVDLQFSEEFPYKEGVLVRRFQLVVRLSLEAERIFESAAPGSMAVTPPPPAAVGDKS